MEIVALTQQIEKAPGDMWKQGEWWYGRKYDGRVVRDGARILVLLAVAKSAQKVLRTKKPMTCWRIAGGGFLAMNGGSSVRFFRDEDKAKEFLKYGGPIEYVKAAYQEVVGAVSQPIQGSNNKKARFLVTATKEALEKKLASLEKQRKGHGDANELLLLWALEVLEETNNHSAYEEVSKIRAKALGDGRASLEKMGAAATAGLREAVSKLARKAASAIDYDRLEAYDMWVAAVEEAGMNSAKDKTALNKLARLEIANYRTD